MKELPDEDSPKPSSSQSLPCRVEIPFQENSRAMDPMISVGSLDRKRPRLPLILFWAAHFLSDQVLGISTIPVFSTFTAHA